MARADRLDGWADGQAAKSTAKLTQGRQALDQIPLGQPVMTDHYSYRGDMSYRRRAHAAMDAGFAAADKARSQSSRAANIRAATDASIFDDDENAVEALTARIVDLEAQRARITAFNKVARQAKGDTALIAAAMAEYLDAGQQQGYLSAARHSPYSIRNGAYPAYGLSNLSGQISKQRKRLEQLQRQAALEPGTVTRRCMNKYAGDCRVCGQTVDKEAGMAEKLHGEGWTVRHHDCTDRESR
jgi:DNA repair exonuclease SbcCD ATPase subunit